MNSSSTNKAESAVYLVTLVDTSDGASYCRNVRATSGYRAAAYALLFDGDGMPQGIDGYQVVTVLSLARMREIVESMEAHTGADVGEVDTSPIEDEIPDDAIISP